MRNYKKKKTKIRSDREECVKMLLLFCGYRKRMQQETCSSKYTTFSRGGPQYNATFIGHEPEGIQFKFNIKFRRIFVSNQRYDESAKIGCSVAFNLINVLIYFNFLTLSSFILFFIFFFFQYVSGSSPSKTKKKLTTTNNLFFVFLLLQVHVYDEQLILSIYR